MDRSVTWIKDNVNDGGSTCEGLHLNYPDIGIHAICKDVRETTLRPYLYMNVSDPSPSSCPTGAYGK